MCRSRSFTNVKGFKDIPTVLSVLMVNYNAMKYIIDEGEKKNVRFLEMWMSKSEIKWDHEISHALTRFNPKIQISYIDENYNKCLKWVDNPKYTKKPQTDLCEIELFIQAKYRYENNRWYFDDGKSSNKKPNEMIGPDVWERAIERWKDVFTLRDIQRYTDRLPFEPWIMINISPDWKGQEITPQMICDLKNTINTYMKEGWYERWEFALEGGSEGDFLHAHIVAKLGSKTKSLAMVKGHCWGRKMNHQQQLLKYASKTQVLSSALKRGTGIIHKIIINHPDMLKDKLDYLVESRKPAGHKNKKLDHFKTHTINYVTRGNFR